MIHPDELKELYERATSRYPNVLIHLCSSLGYYKVGDYGEYCGKLRNSGWNSSKNEFWNAIWETNFAFLWLILVAEGYEK